MNRKKLTALICAVIVVSGLASCSREKDSSDNEAVNSTTPQLGEYRPPESVDSETEKRFVDTGSCGENARYVLYNVSSFENVVIDEMGPDFLLEINGTGMMYDYEHDELDRYAVPLHELQHFKKAVVSEGITSIGRRAFSECIELREAILPSTLNSIDAHAFDGCYFLRNMTIPVGVTTIGEAAFKGCVSFSVISVPNSVTSIGEHAFSGCGSLMSVSIPNSVTSIGDGAFDDCPELTITCYEGSYAEGYAKSHRIKYKAIPGGSDDAPIDTGIADAGRLGDNVRYTLYKDGSLSVTGTGQMCEGIMAFKGNAAVKNVTISEGITSIGSFMFYDCPNLASVKLPKSVTGIGQSAFENCTSLTSIELPEGLLAIRSNAFAGCTNLRTVKMPDKLWTIGSGAFADCSSLEIITIPDGVTEIGEKTFEECTSLKSITLPDGLTSIGQYAFAYCKSLTSIELPETLTSIGQCAFQFCESLTSLTVPKSVTTIEVAAFGSCKSLTVRCYAGSVAESYLKEREISFEIIEEAAED